MDCPQTNRKTRWEVLVGTVQRAESYHPQKPTTCCQVLLLGGYTKVGVHSTAWPVRRPRDEGLGGLFLSPIAVGTFTQFFFLFLCGSEERPESKASPFENLFVNRQWVCWRSLRPISKATWSSSDWPISSCREDCPSVMFFCGLLVSPILSWGISLFYLVFWAKQIRARIASIISIILSSLSSILLLSLAMASLGDISSSLVTKMKGKLERTKKKVLISKCYSLGHFEIPWACIWPI